MRGPAKYFRLIVLIVTERVLDWKNYYPLHLIYTFMMDLETQFPSTCTVSSIGKSVEGRDIKVGISNNHSTFVIIHVRFEFKS